MSSKIKITFRKPTHGSMSRSILYINGENHGFISHEEEYQIREKIYDTLCEFSQKQKALQTMRGSK